jgi:hypothetical protein
MRISKPKAGLLAARVLLAASQPRHGRGAIENRAAAGVSCTAVPNVPPPIHCTAVGSVPPSGGDQTAIESYNGSTWSSVTCPAPDSSTGSRFNSIFCTTDQCTAGMWTETPSPNPVTNGDTMLGCELYEPSQLRRGGVVQQRHLRPDAGGDLQGPTKLVTHTWVPSDDTASGSWKR